MSSSIPDDEPDWWEVFVKEKYPDDKCLKYFKCTRKTYTFLIEALKPYLAPKVGTKLDRDAALYLRKSKILFTTNYFYVPWFFN